MNKLQESKPEEIQALFDKVIDSGHYHHAGMCKSVGIARAAGILNNRETAVLEDTIRRYLIPKGYVWLYTALKANGLPHGPEARLAIYRDWANRPKLSEMYPTKLE